MPVEANKFSFNNALKQFNAEERIDGRCESCGKDKTRVKVQSIDSFKNDYLLVQLKLFNNNQQKISTNITDLQIKNQDIFGTKFNLIGTIVHSGNDIKQGHYFTFVRKENENSFWKLEDHYEPKGQITQQEALNGAYILLFKKS